VVGRVEQRVDVLRVPLAGLEPAQDLHHPVGPLPAWRALAARLVRVELGPAQDRADDTCRVVEDLQRLGAEHRSGRADGFVVERHVEMFGGEDRRRGTARRPELELPAFANTTGEVEQLPKGQAERTFVLTWLGDVAGERVEREARRLLTSELA